MLRARSRGVFRVVALADHTFEVVALGSLEQGLALARHVIDVAHDTEARHQHREQLLAHQQRARAQVAARRREQIERVVDERGVELCPRDLGGIRQREASLQALEGAAPARVRRHDLAVEHELPRRELRRGPRELGVDVRRVAAAARNDPYPALALGDEHARAVVLGLEDPAIARERLVGRRREHGPERIGGKRLAACSRFGRCRGQSLRSLHALGDLDHVEAREHRAGLHVDQLGTLLGRLALPDQQPVPAALAPRAHQREAPAQLVPVQVQVELAELAALGRGSPVHRAVRAAVPDDHRAGTVVAGRDHALEAGVLQGMILGAHGEPLLGGVERRAAGDRPACQHTVDLQPQVPVHVARGVLLHHEQAACAGRQRARSPLLSEGLGRARAVPLLAVGVQVWHGLSPQW